ncbi:nuclease-related domain-containing protein [Pseudalkalibacillus decolorationis]|uniref:nuclease-related domain-containing protein n=1 Tax=Pseudalkalibacillus decolorationis TaxID=163879 RepID=UPI0021490784|nr:nuclease-related domain-containing protein [Pseudalkalibacillus decolorationis]
MNFHKARYEMKELIILRSLNTRIALTEKESSYYWNLEKGFQGEQKFDGLLETLSGNYLILNDLLLEINNSTFQIDSTLIFKDTIYLVEVKNYEGDSYLEGDRWINKNTKKERKNPILQLKRSESLFRQLMKELNYNSPIESYLVFINPNFYLYHAPMDPSIILPPHINRFIDKISLKPPNLTDKHLKFAQKLRSLHLNNSSFMQLPTYNYDHLEKGITCPGCHTLISEVKNSKLICESCGCSEDVTSAVLRSAKELSILFPEKSITVNTLHEWCKIIKSKKTIRRILVKNYKLIKLGKSSHYVCPQKES